MKKIFLVLVVLLVIPGFVLGSNLRITNFEIEEPVVPRTNVPILLEIENVGEEILKTGIPHKIYGVEGMSEGGSLPLLGAYTGRHGVGEPNAIEIRRVSGEVEEVVPTWGEFSYVEYDPQTDREGVVLEIYNATKEGYYIELNPGDTVIFDSTKAKLDHGIWIGVSQLSLESYLEEMNFLVYEEGSADKKAFTKNLVMAPTVTQLDEDTYRTAYVDAGCLTLEEKEICILIEDEFVTFSVDNEAETYDLYGFFWSWLNKVFGDGAISDNLVINDVTVRLYEEFFTISL